MTATTTAIKRQPEKLPHKQPTPLSPKDTVACLWVAHKPSAKIEACQWGNLVDAASRDFTDEDPRSPNWIPKPGVAGSNPVVRSSLADRKPAPAASVRSART